MPERPSKLRKQSEQEQRLEHLPLTSQGVRDLDSFGGKRPQRALRKAFEREPNADGGGCPRCGSPFARGCPCEDENRAPRKNT